MQTILIILFTVLIFVVLYQIGRASELSTILKEEEATNERRNNWMGWAFLLMLPLLFIGIYYCHKWFDGKLLPQSASDHGRDYDKMFITTLIVTGIVFVITQITLFWFSFKYRSNKNRTAFYFAHSNTLEIIWTVIPAIAMAVLVYIGLENWFQMTSDAPPGSQQVEVIGKQFNWIMRYPGKDGVFGKRDFQLINDANNVLGLDWNDPHSKDDIISTSGELHLAKGKSVNLILGSRDVIHDVGLPHFRMKMDAVPGLVTKMWFTPIITTDSMKKITNNPNFVYEISCDQMCGKGHYAMKGTVIVHEQAELDEWLDKQQPYYAQNNAPAAAPADSAAAPKGTMSKKISMIK